MKASHVTHWSKGIRPFLIAALIAFIALATVAMPVAHASGGGGPDSSCDSSYSSCDGNSINDPSTTTLDQLPTNLDYYCGRVHDLGGKWPMHLYVGDCLISNIKNYRWTVTTVEGVLDRTLCEEIVLACLTVHALAFFIQGEIGHLADETSQCGNQGVYIHVYGGFFRSHSVC